MVFHIFYGTTKRFLAVSKNTTINNQLVINLLKQKYSENGWLDVKDGLGGCPRIVVVARGSHY